MTQHTIGIDISKDWLDVHHLPDSQERRFGNDRAGHKALIAWIGKALPRIVYEPTGPYHRGVERALAAAGFALVKVNPRQARRFAEATGKLAKTDRLDAAMLARMGSLLDLQARPVADDSLCELKELNMARQALIKDRTAARNRARTLTLTLLKRHNTQRLRQIEQQMIAIEAAILARLQAEPQLARRLDILTGIPGLARLTACVLIIEMPELGSLDGKQAASLSGLAPVCRQSGTWKGRAFIRGGRAQARRALYMPALVACRYNADLAQAYQRLRKAGKPPKLAITAVMRKLIVLANALLRHDRKWSPAIA
jgi:transposase